MFAATAAKTRLVTEPLFPQAALQMPRQFHTHLTILNDKPPAEHIGRRLL
ncbi:hypothetical protein ABIF38_006711 [Bradyrhizobium japonicum]|jgi:hypothetical protein|nr:hypothetical protein [Bradyrhizobium elkanii]MBR1162551.1 hypothetical protein [Bradyrhizobium elkanii]MCP1730981.1 hypothetical protein [Bradyrhizobium elkanii]MCP1969982.1 hypothetical protein [Bradyrhizobium elkanii]MCS3517143.1 hypothetical protein [Bradyrhizobium elkanii]MCS3575110.1 hypothetical protein [Bradyrhizobium elkanii]